MIKLLPVILFIILLVACTARTENISGEWVLTNLFEENVSRFEKPLTLKLDTANRASGFAGCNQYYSTFSVNKAAIKFTDTGSTEMFCEETMATETKFLTALQQVQSFDVKRNRLVLFMDKKVILEFTR